MNSGNELQNGPTNLSSNKVMTYLYAEKLLLKKKNAYQFAGNLDMVENGF